MIPENNKIYFQTKLLLHISSELKLGPSKVRSVKIVDFIPETFDTKNP